MPRVALQRESDPTDVRKTRVEIREVNNVTDFINGVFEDVKAKIMSVMKENAALKQ